MTRLVFLAVVIYSGFIFIAFLIGFWYFQQILSIKKIPNNADNENNENSKNGYVRVKIMFWSSLILVVVFSLLLGILLILNIK